ncbi:MAG: sugar phosphate isomerase/epimerase [Gammaproteobacteria bacterium]|nr:sugar phosphate isomerase/epimerase [Gammaproteobacteria bacterium]
MQHKNHKLEIFQSTWAMELRHPDKPEWSFQEKCELAAQAGYDGLNIDLCVPDMPPNHEIKQYLTAAGLDCSITAFPTSVESLKPVLEMASELDATSIIVNARYFPFTPQEGTDYVEQSVESGKQFQIPVYFETHRLTLTNDLLYTVQLLEHSPSLKLVADLSHYVVGREFPMPVDNFHNDLITSILKRSVSIQGRVATREQIQVPIDFPQNQNWVEQFYVWWENGIQLWLEQADDGDTFNFTCELGPPDYAITDAKKYELSDRWKEALVFKEKIESLWQKLT